MINSFSVSVVGGTCGTHSLVELAAIVVIASATKDILIERKSLSLSEASIKRWVHLGSRDEYGVLCIVLSICQLRSIAHLN